MKSPDNWPPLVELATSPWELQQHVHVRYQMKAGDLMKNIPDRQVRSLHQISILLSVFQVQHSIWQVSVHQNILLLSITIRMLRFLKQHNMVSLAMQ